MAWSEAGAAGGQEADRHAGRRVRPGRLLGLPAQRRGERVREDTAWLDSSARRRGRGKAGETETTTVLPPDGLRAGRQDAAGRPVAVQGGTDAGGPDQAGEAATVRHD